jgi:hypothetical protein
VIAVRIARAAERVSKVPKKAAEPLDFPDGRRSDGRASGDMFAEFVQRHVEVFGGRPIQSKHDVVFHPGDLTIMPRRVRGALTLCRRGERDLRRRERMPQ